MLGEMRAQYERNGITIKQMSDTAVADAQQATQTSTELTTQLADTAGDAVQDVNAEIAKNARVTAKRAI